MQFLFPETKNIVLCDALPCEEGVTRRDPSPVIKIGSDYHVYYTKAFKDRTGYYGTVWHAQSPDGLTWQETGEALGAGNPGQWDDHAVFTPTVLVWREKIYLYYTAVSSPFSNDDGGPNGNRTAIGVAVSETPEGNFTRLRSTPVLEPTPETEDGYRVDDSCVVVREGKIWLYYKGRAPGQSSESTKMFVAMSSTPEGPFVKYAGNPVLDSGHEVCVWPHGKGVASMISRCGPSGHTLQYAEDGLHFKRCGEFVPPLAPGPYRADHFQEGKGPGVTWGLCEAPRTTNRPHLMRWDCDLSFVSERKGDANAE